MQYRLKSAMLIGPMRTLNIVDSIKSGSAAQTVLIFNASPNSVYFALHTLEKQAEIKWPVAVTGEDGVTAGPVFSSIKDLSVISARNSLPITIAGNTCFKSNVSAMGNYKGGF